MTTKAENLKHWDRIMKKLEEVGQAKLMGCLITFDEGVFYVYSRQIKYPFTNLQNAMMACYMKAGETPDWNN